MEINTLQLAINKKAEQKLNKYIDDIKSGYRNLVKVVYKNNDIRMYISFSKDEKPYESSLKDLFSIWNGNDSKITEIIRERLISEFINDETNDFINKMEDVKNRIENLENYIE